MKHKRQLTGDLMLTLIDCGTPWIGFLPHTHTYITSVELSNGRLLWFLSRSLVLGVALKRKLKYLQDNERRSCARWAEIAKTWWGRMNERKMDWGDLKIKLQEANHMIVRGPRLWLMQCTHAHMSTTGAVRWF